MKHCFDITAVLKKNFHQKLPSRKVSEINCFLAIVYEIFSESKSTSQPECSELINCFDISHSILGITTNVVSITAFT
jgi:hypothetical protein